MDGKISDSVDKVRRNVDTDIQKAKSVLTDQIEAAI